MYVIRYRYRTRGFMRNGAVDDLAIGTDGTIAKWNM